ncbi:mannose-1-phosphate guanylyltransferase [candidate division WWE3 bacterium]|nr:mannose-1-phosphate guanylyltransferase [candidate division WWE3 bacterium]
MKAVVFCGGSGKRLWPLSREHSPKQLNQHIFGGKSTFQMTMERANQVVPTDNIMISTNKHFLDEIVRQAPEISKDRIVCEPEMRDVAAAVGLMAAITERENPNEPMLILWSDHMVDDLELFTEIIQQAEQKIERNEAGIVFIGHKPRYAEENLGYIGCGDLIATSNDVHQYEFNDWYYRPSKERAEEFYLAGTFAWNTGYFVTTPSFILDKFQEYAPEMYGQLIEISHSYKTQDWEKTLNSIYPRIEKISFDDKILTKIRPNEAIVLTADFGWFDPGSLYSLKSYFNPSIDENVIKGLGITMHTTDSLVFNEANDKPIVLLGLEQKIVINMKDVVLIIDKEYIPQLKELLESLKETDYAELL